MLFFQVSGQVYSVLGQTEGRTKAFLERASLDISSKLSCGDNIRIMLSVHHPIPALPVRVGNTLTIFKTNQ